MADLDDELWTRFETHCYNEGLSDNRINKLRSSYRQVRRGLNVPLDEAEEKHLRDFVKRLHRDEFTRQDGEAYSGYSKRDLKKFLKQFYKWLEGERGRYPDKVVWINTKVRKDELPDEKRVLTIDEVHRLAKKMPDQRYKGLIYILFDSGFRISELLSAKKSDFELDEYDTADDGECWWISCRESKTYTRRIPLPLFTDRLNAFASSGYYRGLESDDDLFQMSYDAIRMMIKRRAKELLDENITPHHFRHSSATYYARQEGDHIALCDRYGWAYGSDVPKEYIRRSGKRQEQTAQKVANNKVQETQKRVDELEEENKELKQRLNKLERLMDTVTK